MNILFTTNSGYLEHVFDCIQSIVRFVSQDGYDFYILHSDVSKEKQNRWIRTISESNVRFHFIYVDPSELKDFPESERYPLLIYYRIFAAELLPDTLDRILYLDGDTLVINALDTLYNMDFNGNFYMACTHVRKFLNIVNQIRLGVDEEMPYINSGVMLMNLKLLRKVQNKEEIISFVNKNKNRLTLPDQDVISALYRNKIQLIDTFKYNLSDRMIEFHNAQIGVEKIDIDWVRKNTVVVHYYGKQKPWKKPYIGQLNVFYDEIKGELHAHSNHSK